MSCNCSTNCNCSDVTVPTGDPGSDGRDGQYGGFSSKWVFSGSTSSGPSSTEIRLNNTTPASVTAIYTSDTNADSANLDLFLDSISNSSNYGYVRIFREFDSNTFWMGEVTGVTDNGTDHTTNVTYILHNGTFSAGDNLVLTFTPKGATGAAGTNAYKFSKEWTAQASGNSLTITQAELTGYQALPIGGFAAGTTTNPFIDLHVQVWLRSNGGASWSNMSYSATGGTLSINAATGTITFTIGSDDNVDVRIVVLA